jgi:hypothetical protein
MSMPYMSKLEKQSKRVDFVIRCIGTHAVFIIRFAFRCAQIAEMLKVSTRCEINVSSLELLFCPIMHPVASTLAWPATNGRPAQGKKRR